MELLRRLEHVSHSPRVARLFDPRMVQLDALEYASPNTVLFQRLSVVLADLVFFFGLVKYG